ncbi:MAG TPA: ABC transporter ATP-binding protein [Acidimicrobiales bacterium]|nr:ABC transporter ATP-binding protein [Acidimicrobiales bacterium]
MTRKLSASACSSQVPVLEVVEVTKSYGAHRALQAVDLTVAAGQVVGLLGPNGAGKTTLLSIVAGLLQADGGTVRVSGSDIARDPLRAQRSLGFAPQGTGLYEPLTVEQNLRFFGELAGLRHRQLDRRIAEVSEALLLGGLRSRQCQQLSGGEKRRAHTAIALISQPPLVLMDEPTVGADIETRVALIRLVRDLAAQGTAVLYTTHYLPEVEALDAAVVLVNEGRVIARGSVDQLIAAHGSGELELRFTGPAPLVEVGGLFIQRDGDRLCVSTPDPAPVAAQILHKLDADIHRLDGISILRPSLESVFLNLTGHHLRESEDQHDAA